MVRENMYGRMQQTQPNSWSCSHDFGHWYSEGVEFGVSLLTGIGHVFGSTIWADLRGWNTHGSSNSLFLFLFPFSRKGHWIPGPPCSWNSHQHARVVGFIFQQCYWFGLGLSNRYCICKVLFISKITPKCPQGHSKILLFFSMIFSFFFFYSFKAMPG